MRLHFQLAWTVPKGQNLLLPFGDLQYKQIGGMPRLSQGSSHTAKINETKKLPYRITISKFQGIRNTKWIRT